MQDKNQYLWIPLGSTFLDEAISLTREELDLMKDITNKRNDIISINLKKSK